MIKSIKIKENIKIQISRSEWRCAYCHKKILEMGKCVALYDVIILNDKKINTQGNGLKIHLSCVNPMFKKINKTLKTLKKEMKEEIKRLVIESLKNE